MKSSPKMTKLFEHWRRIWNNINVLGEYAKNILPSKENTLIDIKLSLYIYWLIFDQYQINQILNYLPGHDRMGQKPISRYCLFIQPTLLLIKTIPSRAAGCSSPHPPPPHMDIRWNYLKIICRRAMKIQYIHSWRGALYCIFVICIF